MVSNRPIPYWDICLDRPPEVIEIGRMAHGFERSDRFILPELWALHLYSYEATVKVGKDEVKVRPGYVGITPPGVPLETRYQGISVHIYAHFKLETEGPSRKIAAVQDLGEKYELYYRRLYELVGAAADNDPRASARIWDILFDLLDQDGPVPVAKVTHPAVKRSVHLIGQHLDAPLVVEEIARQVGVSYSYLARLFHAAFGTTVVAFIHDRRMERALQLLERSSLPIKSVAQAVGIPDPHHFNKAIRQRFGLSPRKVRVHFLETGRSVAAGKSNGTGLSQVGLYSDRDENEF